MDNLPLGLLNPTTAPHPPSEQDAARVVTTAQDFEEDRLRIEKVLDEGGVAHRGKVAASSVYCSAFIATSYYFLSTCDNRHTNAKRDWLLVVRNI